MATPTAPRRGNPRRHPAEILRRAGTRRPSVVEGRPPAARPLRARRRVPFWRRRRSGYIGRMRVMFVLYTVLIAVGLAYFTVIGLAHY